MYSLGMMQNLEDEGGYQRLMRLFEEAGLPPISEAQYQQLIEALADAAAKIVEVIRPAVEALGEIAGCFGGELDEWLDQLLAAKARLESEQSEE